MNFATEQRMNVNLMAINKFVAPANMSFNGDTALVRYAGFNLKDYEGIPPRIYPVRSFLVANIGDLYSEVSEYYYKHSTPVFRYNKLAERHYTVTFPPVVQVNLCIGTHPSGKVFVYLCLAFDNDYKRAFTLFEGTDTMPMPSEMHVKMMFEDWLKGISTRDRWFANVLLLRQWNFDTEYLESVSAETEIGTLDFKWLMSRKKSENILFQADHIIEFELTPKDTLTSADIAKYYWQNIPKTLRRGTLPSEPTGLEVSVQRTDKGYSIFLIVRGNSHKGTDTAVIFLAAEQQSKLSKNDIVKRACQALKNPTIYDITVSLEHILKLRTCVDECITA